MRRFFLISAMTGLLGLLANAQDVAPGYPAPVVLKNTTHESSTEVKIKQEGGKGLQTLCLDKSGQVLALVAQPRYFNSPAKDVISEIQVFSDEGKAVDSWKVPFHAHSLNVGNDGTVYVAGDGKIARFDKTGKAIGTTLEIPHIAELFKDKDAMKKKAEESLKQQKEQFLKAIQDAKKQLEERIKKIEEKKPEDRTKTEVKQLEQSQAILKSYASSEDFYGKRTVEQVIQEMTSRLRIINGIAVSEKDVFVATGETAGYGYAIWRMDLDLKNPKKVLGDIGGCCGQMDIQTQGTDLLVAENTKHQFARYDRDGKSIGSFGKRAGVGGAVDPECFGGCCNPMNLRAVGDKGDILTAESEGIVKRFSAEGKFLGNLGQVNIAGGCKNVAVAANKDASKVYFCDQPGSRFFILKKKAEK